MKRFTIQGIIIAFIVILISSCGSEPQGNKEQDSIIDAEEPKNKPVEDKSQVFYRVPTPDELYSLIKESTDQYKPGLMNPKDNIENYNNKGKRAVNLGVYTADLAYGAAFEDYQKAIDYFDIIFEMSDEIGFSSVFTENFLDRVKSNLSNSDSLVNITNETYYAIVKYLEENDKQVSLVLNSTGGWVESMYIAVNLINEFDQENEGIKRIMEQKLVLENLVAYMSEFKDNTDVKPYYLKMQELKMVYDKVKEIEIDTVSTKQEGNKLIIGGGKKIEVTKENYEAIKNKIEEIRTWFVQ